MPSTPYRTVIERGANAVNDRIIDWLKPRVKAPYLDIGCNTGWLLSEVPGGKGIDLSADLVQAARAKGLDARVADAASLPFNREFATAVLSCVLEQCPDWRSVLREARRAAAMVIGVNPYPGKSAWGSVQGCVQSVIPPEEMQALGARIEQMDEQRYYFEMEGES